MRFSGAIGPAVLLLVTAACSSGDEPSRPGALVDDPPSVDAGRGGRSWNPRPTFDCTGWCRLAAKKCPAQLGGDAGAGCAPTCESQIAAAGVCATEFGGWLVCTMVNSAYRCDLPSAQQTECSQELVAFQRCRADHVDAGPIVPEAGVPESGAQDAAAPDGG
jgi:hypothetical protein